MVGRAFSSATTRWRRPRHALRASTARTCGGVGRARDVAVSNSSTLATPERDINPRDARALRRVYKDRRNRRNPDRARARAMMMGAQVRGRNPDGAVRWPALCHRSPWVYASSNDERRDLTEKSITNVEIARVFEGVLVPAWLQVSSRLSAKKIVAFFRAVGRSGISWMDGSRGLGG